MSRRISRVLYGMFFSMEIFFVTYLSAFAKETEATQPESGNTFVTIIALLIGIPIFINCIKDNGFPDLGTVVFWFIISLVIGAVIGLLLLKILKVAFKIVLVIGIIIGVICLVYYGYIFIDQKMQVKKRMNNSVNNALPIPQEAKLSNISDGINGSLPEEYSFFFNGSFVKSGNSINELEQFIAFWKQENGFPNLPDINAWNCNPNYPRVENRQWIFSENNSFFLINSNVPAESNTMKNIKMKCCNSCGRSIDETATFCIYCGNKV